MCNIIFLHLFIRLIIHYIYSPDYLLIHPSIYPYTHCIHSFISKPFISLVPYTHRLGLSRNVHLAIFLHTVTIPPRGVWILGGLSHALTAYTDHSTARRLAVMHRVRYTAVTQCTHADTTLHTRGQQNAPILDSN